LSQALPPQRRRIIWKLVLFFCAFSVIGLSLLGWYVSTSAFQQRVRRKVIESAEKMTGGRVELGELHVTPFRLRVDARNLIIHGRETSDEVPFMRIDRLQAELKIISIFSTTVGLHSLVLEHPVAHVIAYADGTTNVPNPQYTVSNYQGPLGQLVSLSVGHIEVDRGVLLWEDNAIPLDFAARDLSIFLNYSLLRRQYEARVIAKNVDSQIQRYPSFVWSTDTLLVLARHHIDITSMGINSGNSDLHFVGRVDDFQHPRLTGEYRGSVDLGQMAFVIQQMSLQSGTAQFQGKGWWSFDNFSMQGNVQSKDIEWENRKLLTRNGRFAAGFSITPQRLQVSGIKASLFGGDLSGDAEVINWRNSSELARLSSRAASTVAGRRAAGRTQSNTPQHGSLHLQLAGFPIFPAMKILSSKKMPLEALNLSANASGAVELVWTGALRNAESRMNLTLTPNAKMAEGEMPLHGQVDFVYRAASNELDVKDLHLSTPASELSASGALTANSAARFSFTSHNLREWWPWIQAAYGSRDLPFSIRGWVTLNGTATGGVSSPSLSGNFAAYDFETRLPAREGNVARSLHWDALSSTVQLSDSHFSARNGVIVHGLTSVRFNASATLTSGSFEGNNAFALDFNLHNADVAEFDRLVGISAPVGGIVNASVSMSGTRENPSATGHMELREGAAYGVDIPLLKSDLRLSDTEITFDKIDATAYGAELSGSAAVNLVKFSLALGDLKKDEFRVNISGQNLSLSRFSRLQSSRFELGGVANFTVRATGSSVEPTLDAHAHIRGLSLDRQRAGDFYIDAVSHGSLLNLNAHSEFEKADLGIAGTIILADGYQSNLDLAFHHLDADSMVRSYLPGNAVQNARIEGTLHLEGPLRVPAELKASAEIQTFGADLQQHVHLQNVGPLRLLIENQTVMLENFHLSGSGTDFTAHGKAQLSGQKNLDVELNGTVNMTQLQSFNPKILSRGTLGINLTASGPIAQPVLQGRLDVKNIFISHNDFPSGLSDLNGELSFNGNRIQIERLSGTTGGGTIALMGSATYQNGALLLDLAGSAQDVRLRYPPGVSSTANANLHLTGTSNGALLSGDVVVTKLAITPGFDFGAYIERSRQGIGLAQGNTLQSRLKLDVHVGTTPELQMQTAVARLSGNADLRLRGTVERPAILGRVEVLEGEVTFNGTKYNLDRGDVSFANPAKTQPIIDLQATTRVRDYDITVQLRGDASVPNGVKVTWQSEPQLPEADVIALLALGRTQEESAAAAQSGAFGFGGDASNLLINEALNSTLNSRLQRLFGASRVKIDPQGLASETNIIRGPQVTIEQELASKLTLTYSTNVSVSNQQIIQAEYHLTRNVSIVALRDQNGVLSFDFKLRRRKK
jgi:translocation and assembly module TamB